MPFEFGDVVLVRFPFTSQQAFKQRPAVVVSNRAYNQARYFFDGAAASRKSNTIA